MNNIDNLIATCESLMIDTHIINSYDYALENRLANLIGIFDPNTANAIRGVSELGASLGKHAKKMLGPFLSKIRIDKGYVNISNIDLNLLLGRIGETYGELNIQKMFIPDYNKRDLKKFKRRRMARKNMRIENLSVPEFFIIELIEIFSKLSTEYNSKQYSMIADRLFKLSWLNEKVKFTPQEIDMENLSNIQFNLKDYQRQFIEDYPILKAKYNFRGFINGFIQGMGKTLTSIALAEVLGKEKVYIVCPNTLTDNWADEIRQYYSKYENNEELWKEEVIICNRTTPDKARFGKYFIINNESIPSIYNYVDKASKSMFILDESHNFRNLNSKRTKELLHLVDMINSDDNLVMSGTPIKAIPNEIVPALRIIDKSFTEEAAKIYQKCFDINSVDAMSIVQRRFGMIIYRVSSDVLGLLPPKEENLFLDVKGDKNKYTIEAVRKDYIEIFNDIFDQKLKDNSKMRDELIKIVKEYSSAPKEDTKLYIDFLTKVNTAKMEGYHELDKNIIESFIQDYIIPNVKDNPELFERVDILKRKFIGMYRSAMALAMGQILHPRRNEMFISLYEDNKDMIHDMILYNTRKTVIFSQFLPVIKHISDDLNKNGIITNVIVGGDKDRYSKIEEFKNDDNIVCLCATSQTLSTGVTLVEANQMFFFGTPWRYTDYEQAYKRIHRIGQNTQVNIYNILLKTDKKNLSTRMLEILDWSDDMFNKAIQTSDELL